MTFNELQKLTSTRYENEFVGVKSSITLGRLRAINIFVTGEVSIQVFTVSP